MEVVEQDVDGLVQGQWQLPRVGLEELLHQEVNLSHPSLVPWSFENEIDQI